MPGPLTSTEKAQIKDHLRWSSGETPAAYVTLYVDPTLDALANEAHLVVVRGHLETLNGLYTQLKALPEGFDIDEAKGIKFAKDAEARTLDMYKFWRDQLATSLDLNINTQSRGGTKRRNRPIR